MFGPIPPYDPIGDTLPLMAAAARRNRDDMMDSINNDGSLVDMPDEATFENMNRSALLAWQERQRRQRTLRMLMMFLMVLLLMDGDDSSNRRHHHRGRQQLRRHDKSRNHWERLGYLDEEGNLISPLSPDVHRSRVDEDEAILRALRDNPSSRYHELVKSNDGMDVEEELRKMVRAKLREEAERMILGDRNNSPPGDGGSRDAADRQRISWTGTAARTENSEKEGAKTLAASDENLKELDDLVVYHYPRNATGYYRGLWVRTPKNKSSDGWNDEERVARLAKFPSGQAIGGSENSLTSAMPRNVTAEEVHLWAQAQLRRRREDVGIMFLPSNLYLAAGKMLEVANFTSGADQEAHLSTAGSSKPSTTTLSATKRPSLSLTKEAGRAAFQLYSRPVPAMSELSIVDGLVKLYDGMTASFVARRTDVLLRVRGVMVHGTGRMSLVTSSAPSGGATPLRGGASAVATAAAAARGRCRSFLGVRQVHDAGGDLRVEGAKGAQIEAAQYPVFGGEEVEDVAGRQRRLRAAVEQLVSSSSQLPSPKINDSSSNEPLVRIREEVMDLYSSHYESDVHAVDDDTKFRKSMEGEGWTLLQSVDEDLFHGGGKSQDEAASERLTDRELAGVDDNLVTYSSYPLRTDFHEAISSTNASVLMNFDTTPNDTNMTWRRSTLLSEVQGREAQARYVFPYPYVVDDAEDSITNTQSPATKNLPNQERALAANAAHCEFEINVNIHPTRWTFGEWRSSMEHRLRMGSVFDPHWNAQHSGGDLVKLKRSQYLLVMKSQLDFLEEQTPKEALVMTMIGDIESKDCNFRSFVNVTAMRTNWENTTAKAINYSFYMMLTCLTQIVVLLRQLLHTQAQSAAANVSIFCVGWQAIIDAVLCIGHIFLCLVMQPLFTAFASVAFFKLLIFCVIEMKYMTIIIQARNNASGGAGLSQEDLRRQVTLLHMKFYGALMSAILAFWFFGQSNRTLYVLLLYSFWVPQIVLNIITESRKPMHPYYVYGMSLTRSVAPIYVFAVRNNFLKEVSPEFPTEPKMCQMLILWIGIQTTILFAQSKYGTRFMIPQRFLPPKFDYSRPIPPSLLPRPASNSSTNGLNADAPPSRERSNGVARNRRWGGNRMRLDPRVDDSGRASMSEDTRDTPTLDCVICYNEIDVNDRKGYMLAPCDHIFHRHCLEQWMDVKMECPICRCNLPSL